MALRIAVLTTLLILGGLSSAPEALAHGGRLNADRCHNDYKNNSYHCHPKEPDSKRPAPFTLEGQARVVDGDTLAIDVERVRISGMDAPETRQTCWRASGEPWACGEEATKAMRAIVANRTVRCDVFKRDRYERAVATCYVNGRDIAAELVGMGFALNDPKYEPSYAEEELSATVARRGIHNGTFVAPWDWRKGKQLEDLS